VTKLHLQLHGHPCLHFNACKALERLRLTEEHVTFASVMGLGEPLQMPVECTEERC